MELLKVVKKQLVADLDKNEAPGGWRFRVDRYIKFDDGAEQIVGAEIPATAEEVQQHVGDALLKQAADIEGFKQEREAFRAEAANDLADRDARLATAAKLNEDLTRRVAEAEARLARIAQADAAYDASVKPLFAPKSEPTVQ